MSRGPAALLFEDMLERIGRIQRSVAGMDHEAFLRSDTVIDAVVRNESGPGEAADRLAPAVKERDA